MAQFGRQTSTGSLKTIETTGAYKNNCNGWEPNVSTAKSAAAKARQTKGGVPPTITVKPTNLQNGSLPDDGGHGGRHHLPQTKNPRYTAKDRNITLPTSHRFYNRQAGGGFYNRQAGGGNAHGVGREETSKFTLPRKRPDAKGRGINTRQAGGRPTGWAVKFFNFQDPPGRGHLSP
jgi:hypothetical protein